MGNKNETNVPFIVHETEMNRAERQIKRLWTAIFILFIGLMASILFNHLNNQMWRAYWSQYDFESYELTTDNGGNANFIGNDGDIYNGESNSKEENPQEPQ